MQRTNLLIPVLMLLIIQYHTLPEDRYEYKKRQNRYEGVKTVGVSAPDLELLSFTGYRETVVHDTSVNLKIKFYMPEDTTLYITAKELIPKEYYLMKPIRVKWSKGWQEFFPWPMDAVLDPLGIQLEQIGLVGRLFYDTIGSGFIVPLLLYHTRHPSNVSKYTIHLKPKETLSRVRYRIFKSSSRVPLKDETLYKTYFAREPFTISIDFTKFESGEYRLVLNCKIKNDIDGPKRNYRFYHNPNVVH